MDIEKVDIVVNIFRKYHPRGITPALFKKSETYINLLEFDKILTFLIDEGIIYKKAHDYYKLHPEKVSDLNKAWGYSNYIQSIDNKKKKEQEFKQISLVKLKNEAKLTSWQVKTFWPVFIIALVGGILGTASFIMQISGNKTTKQEQQVVQPIIKQKTDSLKIIKTKEPIEVKDKKTKAINIDG